MSEPNSNPSEKSKKPGKKDELISLEDLDRILEEEDPEFAKSVSEIGKDGDLKNAQIQPEDSIKVDVDSEDTPEKELKGWRKWFEKFKSWIKDFIKSVSIKIKEKLIGAAKATLIWCKTDLPDRLRYFFGILGRIFGAFFGVLGKFFSALGKNKLASLFLFLALGALGGLVYLVATGKWLRANKEEVIVDFSKVGSNPDRISDPREMIELYRAFPQPEFTVLLDKIKVNLKRLTVNSNPMAAMQFFIALDSQDTAIEVKDREKEIVDLVSREVEEFTYEELNSPDGMSRLKVNIRKVINQILNQGRVQRIYININVSKP